MTRYLLASVLFLAACGSSGGPSTAKPPAVANTTTAPSAPTGGDPAWASKIQPPLTDRMTASRSTDKIQVALWLDVVLVEDSTKASSSMSASVIENASRISAATAHAHELLDSLGIIFTGALDTVPMIFAEATPDQIRVLAKRTEFVRIDFNDTTGIDDAG
jgi:hypothetical protein